MSTATVTLVKIEDHEGNGECRECGRTGLRWIATLSDGAHVGTECAKKVLGWKPSPKTYTWVADFTALAEYVEGGVTWVLWGRKDAGSATALTRNGGLVQMGGARTEWTSRGRAL